jgi:hypothetical protein
MSSSNAVRLAAAGLAMALCATGTAAAQSRWSLGAQVGSSGIGAEAGYMASPHFAIRGEFDNLEYEGEVKGQVLTYKGHFRLNTGALFVDWHPWANGWLVSGGAFFGSREAGGDPELQAVNTIGGQTFTLDQARGITSKIKLDDFAPTLAVGWNNTFYNNHWGFKALAGVVFSNQPTVTLSRAGTTPLPPDVQARLDAALRVEEQKIAGDTDILKTYPLIQLGVAYRF